MKSAFRRTLIGSALLATCAALAAETTHVSVQALFKDRAMLLINGRQQFLRAGETGYAGVRLIAADSKHAEVEVDGKVYQLAATGGVHTNFTEPQDYVVSIQRDDMGAYLTDGYINGQSVRFQVDTGANAVALSSAEAVRIGLDYKTGTPGTVITAAGEVPGYGVRLDRVQIGEIEVLNVRAVVIEGRHPTHVLLGMSFLSEVDLRESAGLMELRR